MANNFLETKTISLGELLGNGKTYKVPPYQRDYSWDEEKWEDLFLDINDLENSKHPHYMGAIVLQTSNNKQYTIIDGQQRIATLSIFIIAIIKLLKDLVEQGIDKDENQRRVDYFSRTFLGNIEPKQLFITSKLELNSINDSFFSAYIVQLRTPAKAILIKEDNSNKLLLKAYDYFYQKLKEKLKNKDGKEIDSYLSDFVADKIKFIQISVEDELGAYTLFETLNARGVELTSTDLLKNYLFSLVGDGTTRGGGYKVLLSDWNMISNVVGTKDFPNFLRYFINSKKALVRHNNLYKEVKKTISNHEQVFAMVEELKELASVYVAFKNPSDELWASFGKFKELKTYFEELKLFGVSQQVPLLLSVYRHFDENEFVRVVRICSVISFRYATIGKLNPNEMERVYNKCAIKVANKELTNSREVFENLKTIYVDDEAFENSFSSISIDIGKRKLIKYILISIENQKAGQDYGYDESDATIEHILPQNIDLDSQWAENFSDDERENLTSRLGNYLLLEVNKNKDIGNKYFDEKKEVYKTSKYLMTNSFNYSQWNIDNIKQHQKEFAKIAKGVWRLG